MSAANRELFSMQPMIFVSFHQGKEKKPAAGGIEIQRKKFIEKKYRSFLAQYTNTQNHCCISTHKLQLHFPH